MQKYLEAYENYDEDKANEIFTRELQSYSQSELINAINIYLSSHDMCKDFALILINQGNRNE